VSGAFRTQLLALGARPVEVLSRRQSPRELVDAASLDGRAPLPTLEDVRTWDGARRLETRAASQRRAIELQGLVEQRDRRPQVRSALAWHVSLVRLLKGADHLEQKARLERVDRERVSDLRTYRAFAEAAERVLPPEDYERVWDAVQRVEPEVSTDE